MNDDLKTIASQTKEQVLSSLQTNMDAGLTTSEADNRIKEHGLNIISSHKKEAWWQDLLQHFKSPLVILLLIAAGISFSISENINASIIILIVIASVLTDFFQERDARNAAEKLKETVKSKATVIRNGAEEDILPQNLCMGDIVLLNAGKIVPADVRILMAKDFFVNQSSLTGESFPCEKQADAVSGPINDLNAMNSIAFMGSSVISGTAKAVVVKTGSSTEFGKIAEKLIGREEETDFSRGMQQFGFLIMKVTIALVLFIFLINALMKENILESFMFAIAIAVGLTPELLPMIMSLTMSKGSLKMAKKGVIVKRLSAIPNFAAWKFYVLTKPAP
ncbi:MAG TPA: HAD-IC family P-type ATPase [Hanamia sp.]|nr:HAD-IC family P-type ATPase [Hanamia sp.]